jgi:hypothetical protein
VTIRGVDISTQGGQLPSNVTWIVVTPHLDLNTRGFDCRGYRHLSAPPAMPEEAT